LTPSDPVPFGQFGESVSISGSHALVGAQGYNTSAGAAYLFDVATGQELRKLALPDAVAGDLFGTSVAISGDLAVIGAPTRRVSATTSGTASVMDVNTGQELFNLMPSDAEYTALGNAVALHGNIAIVGAYLTDGAGSQSGTAYVFDVTTGQQLYKLTPADAAAGDRFGFSVAINDKFAVVSAHRDISDTNPGIGSVYVFDLVNGQQILRLTGGDTVDNDRFGESVAIGKSVVLVGADGDNTSFAETGSAYVFSLVPEPPTCILLLAGVCWVLNRKRPVAQSIGSGITFDLPASIPVAFATNTQPIDTIRSLRQSQPI
jgi:outer membrane protein assembly factor BamB